ncbi:MAG: PAS domain-containing protein [Bacteroidetes bacterium]|jgi:PAS domain S-box-containing protein|nr:PAS domain-containing protein [Bacteroidota bacterium]
MSDFKTLSDAQGHLLFKNAAELSFNAITVTRAARGEGPSTIVYVNDAFTEMTGYTAEDVMGETPGMLQGPKTDPEVLERLDRQIHNGETFHGETVNYRKDGTPFVIEWKVTPIAEDGVTTHYVAVQRDVTDQREASR